MCGSPAPKWTITVALSGGSLSSRSLLTILRGPTFAAVATSGHDYQPSGAPGSIPRRLATRPSAAGFANIPPTDFPPQGSAEAAKRRAGAARALLSVLER